VTGPRVFLYVQHLLGSGHFQRAALIAAALGEAGAEVDLVTGGAPAAHADWGRARLVALPEARSADLDFSGLVRADGTPVDDAWKAARQAALLGAFAASRADAVVTELYPFGRGMLRFELEPLIAAARAARPRPAILCSVRDVLTRKQDPRKRAAMVARAQADYDRVLVHGDPRLIAFTEALPEAAALGERIVYTGYVVKPAPPARGSEGAGEVIVSAGGGAVGTALLRTALAARPLSAARDRTWRLLCGAAMPAAEAAALRAAAPTGVIVEPARPDFPALLARCHVSVSQAGYNTAMDILSAGARAVLIPFAAGVETEQADRAAALARRGWAQVVPEAALQAPDAAPRLAAAIDAAAVVGRPDPGAVARDGAARSAALILAAIEGRG